jgi:hypothetical protein
MGELNVRFTIKRQEKPIGDGDADLTEEEQSIAAASAFGRLQFASFSIGEASDTGPGRQDFPDQLIVRLASLEARLKMAAARRWLEMKLGEAKAGALQVDFERTVDGERNGSSAP